MVVPFGEKVWYKRLRVGMETKNKAETEWFEGIWLGPATGSSEVLIGTVAGVVRAYAVKRFEASQQWDLQLVLDMQWAPQKPDPNKPGMHIPIRIRLEPPVSVTLPSP